MSEDKKQRIREARLACEPLLHQRAISAAEAEQFRRELEDLTSIATGRACGWAWSKGISEKAHYYASRLAGVIDADEQVLEIIESYEIDMAHSCALLREEMKKLRRKVNRVFDKSVDLVMVTERDNIDVLFENWPKESKHDELDAHS